MAKKPAIPVISNPDPTITAAFAAMKENIELITGARAGASQISSLGTSASTAQIISKINEIIAKLNYSGQ